MQLRSLTPLLRGSTVHPGIFGRLRTSLRSLQNTVVLATGVRKCRARIVRGRAAILDFQQRRLRGVLLHAWDNCLFYRQRWSTAGIARDHLPKISIEEIPTVSKSEIQDAFDDVITDPALRNSYLRHLIQMVPDPSVWLVRGYLVITTSGTSGPGGIFVYSERDWLRIQAVIGARRQGALRPRMRRERVATIVAMHNRFAGATFAANLPKLLFDVRLFPVESTGKALVEGLNAFRPDVLTGYSSAIHVLARRAIASQELHIAPEAISVSGDTLTESMERDIVAAWGVPVRQAYVCTEGVLLAERFTGEDSFSVADDLNIVELLDASERPVNEGETGRVVITNLHNRVMPIIRYELGDLAVRARPASGAPFAALSGLRGRVSNPLPLRLQGGEIEHVQVSALWDVYNLGPLQVQFCWRKPGRVRIDYVSVKALDRTISQWFSAFLHARNATCTEFYVNRVDAISPDPLTGKVQVTRMED